MIVAQGVGLVIGLILSILGLKIWFNYRARRDWEYTGRVRWARAPGNPYSKIRHMVMEAEYQHRRYGYNV